MAAPVALATNLNPDIRNYTLIGGVTGSLVSSSSEDAPSVHNCTANPSYPVMERAGAADKCRSDFGGESVT